MKTCSIEGCEGIFYSRGWCARHYKKWLLYGDPLKGHIKTQEELNNIGSGYKTSHGYKVIFKKCTYCQQYDDPKNMYNHYKRYVGHHRKCHNEYQMELKRRRREIKNAMA